MKKFLLVVLLSTLTSCQDNETLSQDQAALDLQDNVTAFFSARVLVAAAANFTFQTKFKQLSRILHFVSCAVLH